MAEAPRIATGLTEETMDVFLNEMSDLRDPSLPSAEVGVIMGSDSDLPVMDWAIDILDEFEIPNEVGIVSAHRTPEWMAYYAHHAVSRGLKLIIAGAGGSAHLPGDVAALTTLPVLGVAIEQDQPDPMNSALGSMVTMPAEGGPLAVTGRNKAAAINAGLFAARILALQDPALMTLLETRMATNARGVLSKNSALQVMDRQQRKDYIKEMQRKKREQST